MLLGDSFLLGGRLLAAAASLKRAIKLKNIHQIN